MGFFDNPVESISNGISSVYQPMEKLATGNSNIGQMLDDTSKGIVGNATGLGNSDPRTQGLRNAAVVAGGLALTGGALAGAGGGTSAGVTGAATGGAEAAATGSGLATLNSGIQAATGLYGLYNAFSGGDKGTQAQNAADPFAPHRAEYANQLDALMKDPSSVQNMPGYQAELAAGTQTTERALAARGQVASGQEMIALNDLGRTQQNRYFGEQFKRLSELSGAGQSPAAGAQLGVNVAGAQAKAQGEALSSLPGVVNSMSSIPNLFASSQPQQQPTASAPLSGFQSGNSTSAFYQ